MTSNRYLGILFLLLFPPVFAEAIASTNTPWFSFFNPGVFIAYSLLYGVSALVIRELWVRDRINLITFVLYCVAFTGLNEGIIANTWFNPSALNFSTNELARFGGVNWHLVVNLILFHAVYSLFIPIMLSFIAFPKLKSTLLLGRRGWYVSAGLLLFIGVGNILPKNNILVPNFVHRIALLSILVLLIMVTLFVKNSKINRNYLKHFNLSKLTLVGMAFSILFILSYFAIPALAPGMSILFSIILFIVSIAIAQHLTTSIDDHKKVIPLIAGLMLAPLIFSFLKISIGQPVIIFLLYCFLWRLSKIKSFNKY